jgi:hypothetical protein
MEAPTHREKAVTVGTDTSTMNTVFQAERRNLGSRNSLA